MNVARILGATAVVVLCSCGTSARAQSAPASHFGRAASGPAAGEPASGRRAQGLRRAAAPGRPADDPLAPYTSRPRGTSSGTPVAAAPERPAPRPPIRDYFPTARVGRYASSAVHVGHHCTPSRESVFGASR